MYQKNQFCKDVNCKMFKIKCTVLDPKDCIYSAKTFHKWLKNNGFSIIDRSELHSEKTFIGDALHLFQQMTKELKAGDTSDVKFRDVILPFVTSMGEAITNYTNMKGK